MWLKKSSFQVFPNYLSKKLQTCISRRLTAWKKIEINLSTLERENVQNSKYMLELENAAMTDNCTVEIFFENWAILGGKIRKILHFTI